MKIKFCITLEFDCPLIKSVSLVKELPDQEQAIPPVGTVISFKHCDGTVTDDDQEWDYANGFITIRLRHLKYFHRKGETDNEKLSKFLDRFASMVKDGWEVVDYEYQAETR